MLYTYLKILGKLNKFRMLYSNAVAYELLGLNSQSEGLSRRLCQSNLFLCLNL